MKFKFNTSTPEQKKVKTADDLTVDIDRMTAQKKALWDEIKDFRVSSVKAQQNYDAMANLTRAITKLTNQRNKMLGIPKRRKK